jgi:hypothetical protein
MGFHVGAENLASGGLIAMDMEIPPRRRAVSQGPKLDASHRNGRLLVKERQRGKGEKLTPGRLGSI